MPRTVLIVDDHASFRRIASKLLALHGYDVVGEAADGEAGLEAARLLRPDLVLLDVQLPGIDGFEVATRLSANGDSPAIVMVSSRDAEDFGDLIARSGARGFIAKDDLSEASLEAVLA
ncbi:MAG TPA: response regulator transcription factor [Thermoleophilaceae bacterium]|nr:response regulator transcription factor [Thermoleophilaceae bacterium]